MPATLQGIEDLLLTSLLTCQEAALHLKHDMLHLLTPRLATALLGADRGMLHVVKHAGLGLVFTVRARCSHAWDPVDGWAGVLQLSSVPCAFACQAAPPAIKPQWITPVRCACRDSTSRR